MIRTGSLYALVAWVHSLMSVLPLRYSARRCDSVSSCSKVSEWGSTYLRVFTRPYNQFYVHVQIL